MVMFFVDLELMVYNFLERLVLYSQGMFLMVAEVQHLKVEVRFKAKKY
jgi:hypothetical protein